MQIPVVDSKTDQELDGHDSAVLHSRVLLMRVELLMEELMVCCLLVSSFTGSVSSISMLCSGYVVVSLSMWTMPIPA